MLTLTLAATVLLARDMLATATAPDVRAGDLARLLAFSTVVGFLIYGNIVFQASCLGHLVRLLRHRPLAFEEFVRDHWDEAEPVAILVPSYKEDIRTIRQTVLTAALQHHPNTRVVLLLDDPPKPTDGKGTAMLRAAMNVPDEVAALFAEPRAIVEQAIRATEVTGARPTAPLKRLLATYDALIRWFDRTAAATPVADHVDAHFVRIAYEAHSALLDRRARQLAERLADREPMPADAVDREYRRLLAVFSPDISVFQRKRYANLSHEPNKAANLNGYIDLLGKRVAERPHRDGLHIVESDAPHAGIVPDATYVLTLDADSLLRPDYALRLASVFEEPGHERVAVVQTPYSAIPNPPGVMERIAGATTDVQYSIHQGFTFWGATFWVGANALLRKCALDDIRTESVENDKVVARYIQDRTVIEDTESTIDLARKGWSLLNYPERLAWSATPPDFGSLLIQRSRWANGGLLILPKAARQLVADRFRPAGLAAFLVRLHYLTSIMTGSFGLLILLFLPLGTELNSIWLPLTALPYFALYWREMSLHGYRWGDTLRVYPFNLMLVPVNMAGVLKSIHQGMTGERVPFGRTPKVEGRTAAPRWAVLSLWGLLTWCVAAAVLDLLAGRWMHATFAGGTGAALAYAVVVYVGIRSSWEDATLGLDNAWRSFPQRGDIPVTSIGRDGSIR